MPKHTCPGPDSMPARPTSRRELLWRLGGGLGGIALAQLLGNAKLLAGSGSAGSGRALNEGVHHPAKAKRVIQLFMNGGVSQMDTFLHRPKLAELHGKPFDPGTGEKIESVTGSHAGFPVMKSPFQFKQHGQSGTWVSS